MANRRQIERTLVDGQELLGVVPGQKVLRLSGNAGKRFGTVFLTPEGIQHYTDRNLQGRYNPETRNVVVSGAYFAKNAATIFESVGFQVVDVTELAMNRLGVDSHLSGVVDPDALSGVLITDEEVRSLIERRKSISQK